MLFERKPPKDFVEWLASSNPEIQIWDPTRKTSNFDIIHFTDASELGISLEVDQALAPVEFESQRRVRPSRIMLAESQTPISFRNISISRLEILSKSRGQCGVKLEDCWVDVLYLNSASHVVRWTLEFYDSWVGSIHIDLNADKNSVAEFKMHGGGVLHFNANEGVFRDDVSLQKIFLPRRDGMYKHRHQSPQNWRDLRSQMMKLHNVSAAGQFQISELSLERRQSKDKIDKFFSWNYERLSDFGNSMVKPLFWLMMLAVVMSLI